jgi:hypothetical protein
MRARLTNVASFTVLTEKRENVKGKCKAIPVTGREGP